MLCATFTVHEANITRLLIYTPHKTHQPLLIRMGRVTADGLYAGADGVLLTIQYHVSVFRAVTLYISPRRALCLIAHKQHIVPFPPSMAFK